LLGLDFWQTVIRLFPFFYVILIPLLLWILRGMLVVPLKEINHFLLRFRRGERDKRFLNIKGAKEIADIKDSFNDMADNIEKLKIENYEQLLERQKVQQQNFQLTIRPHFLQNTFALLYTLTQTGQGEKAGDFILYLSGYFRAIYQGISHLIDFASELSLIQHYVGIANLQYRGRIVMAYDISAAALKARAPALLIHNFVENAIVHGLIMGKCLHITLRAYCEADETFFIISDDGAGIAPEILETINKGEEIVTAERTHSGLHNSYQRIRLLFGERGSMRLVSVPQQGTVVTVRLKGVCGETADCE
jgi:sensor histidine kinase YesM